MKMKTELTGLLVILFFSILFVSCGKEDSTAPHSNKNTSVSFAFPLHNAVISDTVTLKVTLQNQSAVLSVEYYVNDTLIGSADAVSGFQLKWILSNPVIAQKYFLQAKARDKEDNVVISEKIEVHYKWLELITDTDAGWYPNIKKVFVRSTASSLQFMLETFGQWNDPFLITEGISFGVFLDTDQNANTGLTPLMNFAYNVNDIGPNYLMVLGFEGNALYKWSISDSTWKMHGYLNSQSISNNSSSMEFGIALQEINNPAKVDLAALLITTGSSTEARWDWAPNSLHSTYTINKTYTGKELLPKRIPNIAGRKMYILR